MERRRRGWDGGWVGIEELEVHSIVRRWGLHVGYLLVRVMVMSGEYTEICGS